jgi:hypothetical protein
MPLNEAELSRPKRVLVAITLLYVALVLLFQNESSRWFLKSVNPAQPADTP